MIKINPDKEKAKSILNIVALRENFLKGLKNKNEYSTIIAENYYEIIKELCISIALTEGYKAIGDSAHKDTISYIKKHGISEADIDIIQNLRIKRNKSSYEGKIIEKTYLENNREDLIRIISDLRSILKKILNEK